MPRRRCALMLVAALALSAPALAARVAVPQYYPPIAHPPLDPPLRLTGTFGEYREGHFHAGVDLSTGGVVGKQVYAALPGRVIRLRSSGAGYGRSIYLQADDGRLLVYGHLDSFDAPFASYVDSVQRATAAYEQDLWPDSTRFRVAAGQRLGWSGRSGTGPPHLHFEIRRVDMAYNPLLAGLTVVDTVPPVIAAAVGEQFPLKALAASRVTVVAVDARDTGRPTMAPWRVRVTTQFGTTTCEFDSVSWATGMSEVDYLYDLGRELDDSLAHDGLRMWPPEDDVTHIVRGYHELDPGDTLRIEATDANGNQTIRRMRESEVPQTPRELANTRRLEEAVAAPALPAENIRASDWSATVSPAIATPTRPAWRPLSWSVPARAAFESSRAWLEHRGRPADRGELKAVSTTVIVGPATLVLRLPAHIEFELPPHTDAAHVGLYRNSGAGWDYLGADLDSTRARIVAGSRQAGGFALFRDVLAPRIALRTPPVRAVTAPYPQWALEAVLAEDGSGVDRANSTLIVDGAKVPSEWDGEVRTLRWKPWRAPARGRHTFEVIAVDRAGNEARKSGSFVIN